MILLSLAAKQIWPQVLAVAHLKPHRLRLLHSEDATESKGPVKRLPAILAGRRPRSDLRSSA